MTRLPGPLKPLWPYAKQAYTAGTGVLARPAMRLSAARGGWLPTSVADRTEVELARTGSGTVHRVAPGETITRVAPPGRPSEPNPFAPQLHDEIPEQRVVELPHGRVLGPHRAIVTSDGALLHDLVRYFGTSRGREHPLFLHPGVRAPVEIDGVLGVLASRGDANYYHFLHDVLPRLDLAARWAREGGHPIPERWYVPSGRAFQSELLQALGIVREQIVDSDELPHVRAERLVVPTVPDLDLSHPRWPVGFLRSRLLPPGAGLLPGSRIYVTRGHVPHTRIVIDEGELVGALEGLGFRVLDPGALPVGEQIRAFAEAETIVAPHGAALANLTFASPGATVVELFAPDFVQSCYWKLASQVDGLTYRYHVGLGHPPAWRRGRGVTSDIRIDVKSLIDVVHGACGTPRLP